MRFSPGTAGSDSRLIWLRRGSPSNPVAIGKPHSFKLSAIGNAAARETLVTATYHMAAIWTDLFHSLMAPNSRHLCWCEDGPGIGRDARIAYSGLLGRYMARAYLAEHENVRVLVPLDVAKRCLKGTPYEIRKDPKGRGLEADWIGLDDSGLVIVEAKGSYNVGISNWCGPYKIPQVLQSAISQAQRTAIFKNLRQKLPAKRWAIASRWGTENNGLEPTLLAWDPEEGSLDEEDYLALDSIFHSADVTGVIEGMGHSSMVLNELSLSAERLEFPRLRIGDHLLDRGFVAMVGPFGVYPMHTLDDYHLIRLAREMRLNFAIVSMSIQYTLMRRFSSYGYDEPEITGNRLAGRHGLTVVWLGTDDDIRFQDE